MALEWDREFRANDLGAEDQAYGNQTLPDVPHGDSGDNDSVEIVGLLRDLACRDGCVLAIPEGVPVTKPEHDLPDDLETFYSICGGLRLTRPNLGIVSPARFQPVNQVVLSKERRADASAAWYLIAESDASATAELVSIDLRTDARGRCYDSFWDRHGVAGSMPVIAESFTSFLRRVAASDAAYWTSREFVPLGDAYDDRAAGPTRAR